MIINTNNVNYYNPYGRVQEFRLILDEAYSGYTLRFQSENTIIWKIFGSLNAPDSVGITSS